MTRRNKFTLFPVIILVLVGLALPRTVLAYLDPGSGSYIVQILIASVAGVLFAVKSQISRLFHFVRSKIKGQDQKEMTQIPKEDESSQERS